MFASGSRHTPVHVGWLCPKTTAGRRPIFDICDSRATWRLSVARVCVRERKAELRLNDTRTLSDLAHSYRESCHHQHPPRSSASVYRLPQPSNLRSLAERAPVRSDCRRSHRASRLDVIADQPTGRPEAIVTSSILRLRSKEASIRLSRLRYCRHSCYISSHGFSRSASIPNHFHKIGKASRHSWPTTSCR